jgi:hypothetical protein
MSENRMGIKTVTLYTKLGCHLCEGVETTLSQAAQTRRFQFVRRDIAEDPADFERFKDDIPVVLVEGVEIARHRMTLGQLLAALE